MPTATTVISLQLLQFCLCYICWITVICHKVAQQLDSKLLAVIHLSYDLSGGITSTKTKPVPQLL